MEEYRESNVNHHIEVCPYCKHKSLHLWPEHSLAHCANNDCEEFRSEKIEGTVEECPYCEEEELVVWPKKNISICDNEECNFGLRSVDEYEELDRVKVTDEKIDLVMLMQERSAVE